MCMVYVCFWSKVRPRTMGSAFVYSAGSGVNRVQVVLSGLSVRLLCLGQANTLCRYGCMYLFALVIVCVDVSPS